MAADRLRLGTRGSALAMWQAERVQALIGSRLGSEVELVRIRTTGDRDQKAPLSAIGGKGVFIKEIENALIAGDVDLAVHSTKDLPSALAEGTVLAAFPEREDPRDALVVRVDVGARDVASLPEGARIGTGSLRRRCQLLSVRPDLRVADIRGNVDTRLRKLDAGDYDAILLAAAGLTRLGLRERATCILETDFMLPAVAQGILGIQTLVGELADRLGDALDDPEVRVRATAERAFLARFQGDCQVPVAAHAGIADGRLLLRARVVSLDGQRVVEATDQCAAGDREAAADLGARVGDDVLARGGAEILAEIRA